MEAEIKHENGWVLTVATAQFTKKLFLLLFKYKSLDIKE